MNTEQIKIDLYAAANKAATDYLEKYYDGKDQGACGFAWVAIVPRHKGNTRLGKAERVILAQIGAEKDWTGKAYQIWNPAQVGAQNVDCKEAGASAAAKVLIDAGFDAYPMSRLD